MSRKRGKKSKAAVEAVPEELLAEGSGPVGASAAGAADAVATVEDVVTTADIATTDDVVTADDVVATTEPSSSSDEPAGRDPVRAADAAGPAIVEAEEPIAEVVEPELDVIGMTAGAAVGLADATDELAGDGNGDGEDGGDDEGDDAAIVFPTSAAGMDAVQLRHLVEALIFAADRPLTVQRLRQLTRVGEVRRLEQALAELAEDYRDRGLVLQAVSGGYQFRTRTQFSPWVQQLIAGRPVRLSRAQLETLAIIAYRQPITRPEIDDIRGVDSTATLKLLMDRMLIRILGKREEVGRPILYGTTKEFLDFFSLGDLRELPTLREYSELTAESRKVMSDRLGIDPDGNGLGQNGHNGHNVHNGHNGQDDAGSTGDPAGEQVVAFDPAAPTSDTTAAAETLADDEQSALDADVVAASDELDPEDGELDDITDATTVDDAAASDATAYEAGDTEHRDATAADATALDDGLGRHDATVDDEDTGTGDAAIAAAAADDLELEIDGSAAADAAQAADAGPDEAMADDAPAGDDGADLELADDMRDVEASPAPRVKPGAE